MTRLDALREIYDRLQDRVVVTIMGAVAAELQSMGPRPNLFYQQHAMGLASSGIFETICVHGDSPGAVAIASRVRDALAGAGVLAGMV